MRNAGQSGHSSRRTLQTFAEEWRGAFGDVAPLAHHMRRRPEILWTRFYALPEGKRYAQDALERAEVRRRGERLAAEILGSRSACWLVRRWTSQPAPTLQVPEPGEAFDWLLEVRPCPPSSRFRAQLLERVADYLERSVLLMNRDTGAVLAPYDGGFDVFPRTPAEAGRLRHVYAGWRSSRSDRL